MALDNLAKGLQSLQQPRRGAPKGEDKMLRQEVEDEVAGGDFVNFYGDNPVAQQLGPVLGRMLKEKPADYEEKVREGSKGARG